MGIAIASYSTKVLWQYKTRCYTLHMCRWVGGYMDKEKEGMMAKPISATPVLRGEEATKFITMIHEDSNKPVGLIPTPKLGAAQELIKQYSEHGKKQIH